MKRLLEAGSPPQHRKKFPMETGAVPVSSSSLQGVTKEEIKKPLECQHTDNILNYLIKLPCMVMYIHFYTSYSAYRTFCELLLFFSNH